MRHTGDKAQRRRRAVAGTALALALLVGASRPRLDSWPQQARLFFVYMRATGAAEEHMGLMERVTVSFLMAGQKAEKAKEAGARPASFGERI